MREIGTWLATHRGNRDLINETLAKSMPDQRIIHEIEARSKTNPSSQRVINENFRDPRLSNEKAHEIDGLTCEASSKSMPDPGEVDEIDA